MAQRFRAVALQHAGSRLEDGEFTARVLAVVGADHAQRPCIVEQTQQQRAAGVLVER